MSHLVFGNQGFSQAQGATSNSSERHTHTHTHTHTPMPTAVHQTSEGEGSLWFPQTDVTWNTKCSVHQRVYDIHIIYLICLESGVFLVRAEQSKVALHAENKPALAEKWPEDFRRTEQTWMMRTTDVLVLSAEHQQPESLNHVSLNHESIPVFITHISFGHPGAPHWTGSCQHVLQLWLVKKKKNIVSSPGPTGSGGG